jgi:hypothetical protein
VVIVSATRNDLRDEFAMADEAFALSPISARASLPSEQDYDAIREAFMETSRGRWFLGEYAKRNRNADTSMVLDAVARIEETLAAQKQPPPASGLAEALAAITSAVEQARAAAVTALDRLALEETLAPARKGARIIREISWRWREIGADTRICDLLDSQVGAIEGACGQVSLDAPLAALSAAFDSIEHEIAGFGENETAAARPAAKEAAPSPAAVASDEMPADAVAAAADAFDATMETAGVTAEDADAHDDAVLDMIAFEMAAPDESDADYASDTGMEETHIAVAPPADPEPVVVAAQPEPVAAPAPPPTVLPSPQPSPPLSLGSTIIANGIVRRPNASGPDPLAPIRRMSQAEKIALFS